MEEKLLKGFSHVGLYVSDMQKSIGFYTGVLDFEVELFSERYHCAFIRYRDVRIELIEWAEGAAKGEGVIPHIAFDVSDIESVAQRLRDRGIAFKKPMVITVPLFPNGSSFIHFAGPDGEGLELTERL